MHKAESLSKTETAADRPPFELFPGYDLVRWYLGEAKLGFHDVNQFYDNC